jgi:Family of unknown function (DUF6498)
MQIHPQLLHGFYRYRFSAIALIAANALPLLGVIFLKWDAFSIVALYWVENVIIGAINVLKMITCSPDLEAINWLKVHDPDQVTKLQARLKEFGNTTGKVTLANHVSKLFFVPFFVVHYGIFCLVHGVFVFVFFGHGTLGLDPFDELFNIDVVFTREHLWWGVAALAASHLYSFFVNYLGRGEYRRTIVPWLMMQPYARVVVLHIAILFGGFIAMALGSNVGVLTILIIGKTLLDLSFHLRERIRNADDSKQQPDAVLDESPT